MRLVLWFALFVLSISAASCKHGPEVVVCVVDAERMGLQCVRPDETAFFLPLLDAENFVCFSPRDTERLLKACKSGSGGAINEPKPEDSVGEDDEEERPLGRNHV